MALSPWPTDDAEAVTATAELKAAARFAIGKTDIEVARVGAAASALVEREAPGAPQPIRDEAVIRAAGWFLDARPAVRSTKIASADGTSYDREFNTSSHAAGFRHSGAKALLSAWKVRRAGAIA